jgi:AcrR family transcriptional regulator
MEIADAVDISVPTVFNHVPDGKEALMFDDGTERRENLLAAVHERADGQSVMAALREFIAGVSPAHRPDHVYARAAWLHPQTLDQLRRTDRRRNGQAPRRSDRARSPAMCWRFRSSSGMPLIR